MNVDAAELQKFSDLAHKWWDTNSEFKPLHDLNPLRLNWINRHASLHGKRVLDIGCGGGILSESMARLGANVTGIDLADKSLKVAQLHALESGVQVEYQKISAEDYAAQHAAQFDVVTCMEMLEHVPEPASIVRACAALVKPDGKVFFSTLNRHPMAYLQAVLGAEYVLHILPRGTHDYAKFIQPSELAAFARAAQLDVFEVLGMRYNPVTQRYWLNQNTRVNYCMACSKPI